MIFGLYKFELLEIFMGEATIDSTDKPVVAKSKKSAKKEEPKDTIW